MKKKNVIAPTILNDLWTYVCRFSKKKIVFDCKSCLSQVLDRAIIMKVYPLITCRSTFLLELQTYRTLLHHISL